jgi:hypothetical protein
VKGLTKEVVVLWFGVILAFLALEHFTGFSKDVGAIFQGAGGFSKVLQGR